MSRSRFTRSVAVAGAGFVLAVSGSFFAAGTANAGSGKCITVDGTTSCFVVDEPTASDVCMFGSLCELFGSSSLGNLLGSS